MLFYLPDTPGVPLPMVASTSPCSTFCLDPPDSEFQTASRSVQQFSHTAHGSDVIYLWSQCDRHFVGQHVVLCVVKCEDWSRYSNKIESIGLRKCPYYHNLIEKVTSGDMKKLRHCHPMYRPTLQCALNTINARLKITTKHMISE